jgi:hypothetical protein
MPIVAFRFQREVGSYIIVGVSVGEIRPGGQPGLTQSLPYDDPANSDGYMPPPDPEIEGDRRPQHDRHSPYGGQGGTIPPFPD